ncbi:porin [Jiella sp. MQZ9-1]|uniref:Porin n=1 Tax=Jiella flava TaxID=2816857 RepID=A0A939FTR3_9HYPH|nr:porin [Jiella flava]MBO0661392.1 porin [Jiella flava]MCD2470036.1 porin [Jiella flava]
MNIKSLLLGSAAALAAVSGARAADVIVPVAPEPANYVKVCDVYGTGFYYIPGTETCLSVSGYVRYKISAFGKIEDDFGNQFLANENGNNYQVLSQVRARLNFDAREETEYGTLRAFARVQATNTFGANSNNAGYSMDQAYIQLGGLTMGYLDSLWTTEDGVLTDTDLAVGDFKTNRISYTYAANGLSASLSVEDDGNANWTPNVVGLVKYEGGWGAAYLAASYDEKQDTFQLASANSIGVQGKDDAFALKAGVTLKDLIATDSQFKVEGSYAFDPSVYSQISLFDGTTVSPNIGANVYAVPSLFDTLPVKWQAGAGYAQQFGKLGVAVSGAYGQTFDIYGANVNLGKGKYYELVGNVGYEITKNFDMLTEIRYKNLKFDSANTALLPNDKLDQLSGFVQFVRSF